MLGSQAALLWLIVIACGGLFVAGTIKGLTGLGYTTCALPILALAIDLKVAICLVVLPATASSVILSWGSVCLRETVGRFRQLYTGLILGIAVGLFAISGLDNALTTKVLGLTTIAYTLFALINPNLELPNHLENRFKFPVGFCNGFVTAVTGSQILPLLPYLLALKLDSDRLVQAANVAVIISSVIMALGLALSGFMTIDLTIISLFGIIPAALGVNIGNRLRSRLPAAHFRKLILVTMGLMGASLLASYPR